MGRAKGLHDIATHGTLARQGRLISVARAGPGLAYGFRDDAAAAPAWNIKTHTFQRPSVPFNFTALAKREIEFTQSMLQEFDEALAEGMPVSSEAYEGFKMRLAKLKGYAK